LTTEIDADVTTGLDTVLVLQVAALPQPGVLTLVKLPALAIVDALASPASTVTWNVKLLVLNAATDVNVHVTVPDASLTVQLGVVPQLAEAATYVVPAGMASVTVTGPDAVPPELVTASW
jgi:hypothetical protein